MDTTKDGGGLLRYERAIVSRIGAALHGLSYAATDKDRILGYARAGYDIDMADVDEDVRTMWWDKAAERIYTDLIAKQTGTTEEKKEEIKSEVTSEATTPQETPQEVPQETPQAPPKDDTVMTVTGRRAVKPMLISAEELDHKALRPIEWIVDGMIPVGLSVLGAPPKSYKSYMMLGLCAAVAEGLPFLGRDTHKHAALYLDLESTQRRPQARLRQILGYEAKKPEKLYISTSDSGWARVGAGFEEQLTEVIQSNPEIKLVVIDVLSYVRPEGNARAKEYDRDYAAMMPLKKLADRLDIAIICVTHTTKMINDSDAFANITGSQAVTGACDSQMVIIKKRGEDEGRLVVTGRDAEYMDMAVRFDRVCMRWQYLGSVEERQYQQQQTEYSSDYVVTAVMIAMRGKDKWVGTVEDLIAESPDILKGWDTRTVGRHIAKFEAMLRDIDGIDHDKQSVCIGGQTQRQHVFTRIK